MNIRKAFKLITLLQNRSTSYQELVEFLFGETPPEGHNFLARTDLSVVVGKVRSELYDDVVHFEENPNPKVRIALIIQYPFQYFIYKNIYRHLSESEFVIEGTFMKSRVENGFTALRDTISFLKRERVYYRIFKNWDTAGEFFEPYDTLVTYFSISLLFLPCNASKKKVRVMYGHAKDLYNFGAWSHHFDLALTYGPYSNKMIGSWTRAEAVGNARFDDWFSGKITEKTVESIRRHLDPHKKTILYMPTHHDLSSLEFLAPVLGALLNEYNLIIKPHPSTLFNEPVRLHEFKEKLREQCDPSSIFWADDFIDNTRLLFVADVVISDNSGAIFDAILADKPVVLVDALSEDFLDKDNWEVKKIARNSWLLPGLYYGSLDQRIKKEVALQPGEVIKDAGELQRATARALSNKRKYRLVRRKLRTMLFSHCDGSSGKRAAHLIRGLVREPLREKNFLQLALKAEDIRVATIQEERLFSLQRMAEHYINLQPYWETTKGEEEIIFSVVIPTYNGAARITVTLESLIRQKGMDQQRVEILVVDDGSTDYTKQKVAELIKMHPGIKMCYLRLRENRGPAYARNIGIKHARGTYVCFTDDDCILPEDWLANFHQTFKENPEIAGVGGWYTTSENAKEGLLDKFIVFCNLPYFRLTGKSTSPTLNAFGNTANICYRKDALTTVGGFNYFFVHPAFEDLELRERMYRRLFPLMAYSQLVKHQKHRALSAFLYYSFILGWGRVLRFKVHPSTPIYYRVSLLNSLFLIIQHWRAILSGHDGLVQIPPHQKLAFLVVSVFYHLAMWFGKYWIPLEILAKRESRQKNV